MTNRLLRVALAAGLAAFGTVAAAQALPVAACFNDVLKNKVDLASSEQTSLSTLAIINESTYEAARTNASLTARFPFIAGSASYAQFSERRREYFELNKLDYTYYRSIAFSSSTLDAQASGIVKDCIAALARSAEGFHYVASVEDEAAASVQFYWRPPTNGGPLAELKVVGATLENAQIVGQPGAARLFTPTPWYRAYPTIGASSEPVLLRRIDPTKAIRVSLAVEPQVKTDVIVIPAVPRPKKIDRKLVPTTAVYRFNLQDAGFKDRMPPGVAFTKRSRGDSVCSDCDVVNVTVAAPGTVTAVSCEIGEGTHLATKSCDATGSDLTWVSRFNDGNARYIALRYTYLKEVVEVVEP